MSEWPPTIEILTTGDGSPTLAFTRSDGYCEKMHHQAGALAESLYIYGQALDLAKNLGPRPIRALSFGLGLGYNELITLAQIGGQTDKWQIYSFEAVDFLREGFLRWAQGEDESRLSAILTDVANRIASAAHLDASELRLRTKRAIASGQLELRGAFPQSAQGVYSCNLVYYDAYSNKMDSGLWNEAYFAQSLDVCLAPNDCVLATYAATGALNRALKHLGFRLQPKAGFMGKRQSTLAIRSMLS